MLYSFNYLGFHPSTWWLRRQRPTQLGRQLTARVVTNPVKRVPALQDAAPMGFDPVAVGVVPDGAGRDPRRSQDGRGGARHREEHGAKHRHDGAGGFSR